MSRLIYPHNNSIQTDEEPKNLEEILDMPDNINYDAKKSWNESLQGVYSDIIKLVQDRLRISERPNVKDFLDYQLLKLSDAGHNFDPQSEKPYVQPNENKNGEDYMSIRGKDPVKSILQDDNFLQFTKGNLNPEQIDYINNCIEAINNLEDGEKMYDKYGNIDFGNWNKYYKSATYGTGDSAIKNFVDLRVYYEKIDNIQIDNDNLYIILIYSPIIWDGINTEDGRYPNLDIDDVNSFKNSLLFQYLTNLIFITKSYVGPPLSHDDIFLYEKQCKEYILSLDNGELDKLFSQENLNKCIYTNDSSDTSTSISGLYYHESTKNQVLYKNQIVDVQFYSVSKGKEISKIDMAEDYSKLTITLTQSWR